VTHDPNPADERIVDALSAGTRNPSWLADELDYSRQYVHQRLQVLVEAGVVENIGHGLYRLGDPPTIGGSDGTGGGAGAGPR
jgi:predicted ArsR family transcriptional regulator